MRPKEQIVKLHIVTILLFCILSMDMVYAEKFEYRVQYSVEKNLRFVALDLHNQSISYEYDSNVSLVVRTSLGAIIVEMSDIDLDGILDASDNCLNIYNSLQENFDKDELGDACDEDDDNDNVLDINDAFPLDETESSDSDQDGQGDNADTNDDNDSFEDIADNCQFIENEDQSNTDNDMFGDVCDNDDDNDGVTDSSDLEPLNPRICFDIDVDGCDDCSIGVDQFGPLNDFDDLNDGVDTDNNGQCNFSDTDDDNDGRLDVEDNCPLISNPDQEDENGFQDGTGAGDACEVLDDDFCIPVKSKNNSVTLICL